MMDANQKWDVDEAISWMKELADYKPLWIEEPTSPDDILGHAAIAKVNIKIIFLCASITVITLIWPTLASGADFCNIQRVQYCSVFMLIVPIFCVSFFSLVEINDTEKFDVIVCSVHKLCDRRSIFVNFSVIVEYRNAC